MSIYRRTLLKNLKERLPDDFEFTPNEDELEQIFKFVKIEAIVIRVPHDELMSDYALDRFLETRIQRGLYHKNEKIKIEFRKADDITWECECSKTGLKNLYYCSLFDSDHFIIGCVCIQKYTCRFDILLSQVSKLEREYKKYGEPSEYDDWDCYLYDTNRRVYVNCPYRYKDLVKRRGAKFDWDVKKWWFPIRKFLLISKKPIRDWED